MEPRLQGPQREALSRARGAQGVEAQPGRPPLCCARRAWPRTPVHPLRHGEQWVLSRGRPQLRGRKRRPIDDGRARRRRWGRVVCHLDRMRCWWTARLRRGRHGSLWGVSLQQVGLGPPLIGRPARTDARAIAGGLWAMSGALLASLVTGGDARWLKGGVSVVIGVVVTVASWGRFPEWRDEPSSMKWVPMIAAIQTGIVVVIWWRVAA